STAQLVVHPGAPFKAVLVWTDPPGVPLVNDLDLRVTDPSGTVFYGNGQPDHVNNVETVSIAQPLAAAYTISVSAPHLGLGSRQSFALVVSADIGEGARRARAARH